MAEQQLSASAMPWMNLKDDMIQNMKELNDSLTQSMKMMSDDLSKKFDDLKESNSFLEASFNEARMEVSEDKITDQQATIEKQEKKIASLEWYSKYYNLKFF